MEMRLRLRHMAMRRAGEEQGHLSQSVKSEPDTSRALLEELTEKLRVPADSATAAAAAMDRGALAEKVMVPNPNVPALTVVVPE